MPLPDSCLCLASLCGFRGIGIVYMVRVMYVREMRVHAQTVLSLSRFLRSELPAVRTYSLKTPPMANPPYRGGLVPFAPLGREIAARRGLGKDPFTQARQRHADYALTRPNMQLR